MYNTKEENLEAIKSLRIDSIKSISLAQLDEVMTAWDIAMREYCQYSCARCPMVETCAEDCNNFYKMAFFYDIYYRLYGHFTCEEFMFIHSVACYGMKWCDDLDEILIYSEMSLVLKLIQS